jgi:hypothetical protein
LRDPVVFDRSALNPVVVLPSGARLPVETAAAASVKSSAAEPLSVAAGRRLLAAVSRLEPENRRQGEEIRALRAQND